MLKSKHSTDYLVLFTLWLMVFSICSQVNVVVPILPRIGEVLAIPEPMQGMLVGAYAIALSISALFAGPLSDRIGRREIMLLGSTAMAMGLLLHIAADSYTSFIIIRAITGVAGGFLSGSAVAYVGDYFPRERRGWATGYVLSGIAFGQMIGIPAGTLLADAFGFRWTFVVFALTMLVASLLIWRVVPTLATAQRQPGFTVWRAFGNYRILLGSPGIVVVLVANLLTFASINLYLVYLPAWIEGSFGGSGTQIAAIFLVGGAANVIASPMAGRLTDRVGSIPLVVLSCAALGVIMGATTYVSNSLTAVCITFALMMLLVALRHIPFQALLTMLSSSRQRGTLMSLSYSTGQVGMGLGGAVAGLVYTNYGFSGNAMIAAAIVFLMAFWAQRQFPEPQG